MTIGIDGGCLSKDGIRSNGFIASPNIESRIRRFDSLGDMVTGHDIGGKLSGALECGADLLNGNMEKIGTVSFKIDRRRLGDLRGIVQNR